MTKPKEFVPQIDLTSWLLGGHLVTRPSRTRGSTGSSAQPQSQPTDKTVSVNQPDKQVAKQLVKQPEKKAEKKIEKIIKGEIQPTQPTEREAKGKEKDPEKIKPKAKVDDSVALFADDSSSDDEIRWTRAQDKTIVAMKNDNKSWAEIAVAVKVGRKSDVSARFKELKESGEVSTGPAKEANKNPKPTIKSAPAEQDKTVVDVEVAQIVKQKQLESLPEDQAPYGRLMPDTIWTKDDCATLEYLESRHRHEKWLQLQANFYNMTGRMVSSEMIKLKFGALT